MTVAVLALAILAGCGAGDGVDPSTDLSGVWEYSYHTSAASMCAPPAPPGLVPGCAGAGEVTLSQNGAQVSGSITLRGACQTCAFVADQFGMRPLGGEMRGTRLDFAIDSCRHTGTVGSGAVSEVTGAVACTFGGIVTDGTWRMVRRN